jgi:ribosomal protein L35AE/L33A
VAIELIIKIELIDTPHQSSSMIGGVISYTWLYNGEIISHMIEEINPD